MSAPGANMRGKSLAQKAARHFPRAPRVRQPYRRTMESLAVAIAEQATGALTPDPRIETVKKIANALSVGIDDLMK